jgi:hypothetical protein
MTDTSSTTSVLFVCMGSGGYLAFTPLDGTLPVPLLGERLLVPAGQLPVDKG